MSLTKEQEFGIAIKGTLGYLRDLVNECGYEVVYEEEDDPFSNFMKEYETLVNEEKALIDITEVDETLVVTNQPYTCFNDLKQFVKKLNEHSDLDLKYRYGNGRRRYSNSTKQFYIIHPTYNGRKLLTIVFNKHGMPHDQLIQIF